MSPLLQIVHVLRLYGAQELGNFQFLVFNAFAMPALVAYLGLLTAGEGLDAQRFWMAGALTMGIGAAGLAQAGYAVLDDRFRGRLELLKTTPVSKGAYYTAQVGVATLESLALVGVGLFVLQGLGIARLTTSGGLAAALATLCAGTTVAGLGAVMALRAPDFDSGTNLLAIGAVGFALASPVFYEVSDLPGWLRPAALLSPFTHVAALLRPVLAGEAPPSSALLATLLLSLGLNLAGYRLLRWRA